MAFLNPLLLAGLLAVAIPIAVHLFHFRRPQRVDFSTLRFLRAVEATAVRRLRVRQWLLLALRALAVVLLALAFARPTRTAEGAPAAAPAVAVVLDNSRSMTLRDAAGERLEAARGVAEAALAAGPPGDLRALVPTSAPPGARAVPFTAADPALDALTELAAAPGSEPLTAAVARAGSVLDGAGRAEVVVVSDLQASTLTDGRPAALPEGVRVVLVPVGSGRVPENTAVTDVRVASALVEPGRPVRVEATVERFGGARGTVAVTLSLGGERVAESAADLVPGRPTRIAFTVTPRVRGWTGGEVRIEPDAAEWDDVRFFSLRVPPAPRVLVARGAGARADLVTLALAVASETGGLTLTEVDEAALAGADLGAADAVIWVGPSAAGAPAVPGLAAFVAAGGGVFVFPGEDAEAVNPLLAAVGGGRASGTLGSAGGPSLGGLAETDLQHPLFAGVFDSETPRPESPDVRRALRYAPGGGDEATLMRLAAGVPLLQEIRHGSGRVLLAGVGADLAWSDLPQRGLFLPLLVRASAYLAAGSAAGDAAEDGGTVRVEGADAGQPLRLVAPDGTATTPAQRTVAGGVLVDVDPALPAGLYRIVQGERTLSVVARNEDARESDPTPFSAAEAARQLEAATGRPVEVRDRVEAPGGAGGRGPLPLWTWLLGGALLCLVAETVVASRKEV